MENIMDINGNITGCVTQLYENSVYIDDVEFPMKLSKKGILAKDTPLCFRLSHGYVVEVIDTNERRLLPSEQNQKISDAYSKFQRDGELWIYEPCDCGSHIQHNNGGNYHDIIGLRKDDDRYFVKYETTCTLVAEAEWEEIFSASVKKIIEDNSDWL